MQEALSAFILGLSLAAPIGPICLEVIKKGITNGFSSALSVGLGGIAADAFFMALIYFGLAHFLLFPNVQIGLYLFGSLLLLYLGFQSINKRHIQFSQSRKQQQNAHLITSFLTGLSIALFNPINLMFWFGIYGSALAELTAAESPASFLRHSFFLFFGILLWNINLSILATFSSRLLKNKLLPIINIIAGLCLLFFGFHFSYKLAQLLF